MEHSGTSRNIPEHRIIMIIRFRLGIYKRKTKRKHDKTKKEMKMPAMSEGSQLRTLYGPANDPGPQMIPVSQMIPRLYRKRSPERKWYLRRKRGK